MYVQNDWQAIRDHYAKYMNRIMSCPADKWAIDPYMWDMGQHMIFMTPIELNFWADCRDADLILYPQFPAHGYFIDFANPAAKVGVECDGRQFHKDKERDEKRQSILESNGWTIYRITGRQCNENWCDETGQAPAGRVLADLIGDHHGIRRNHRGSSTTEWVGDIAQNMLSRLLFRASQ